MNEKGNRIVKNKYIYKFHYTNSHSKMSTESNEGDFDAITKQNFDKITEKIAKVSKTGMR